MPGWLRALVASLSDTVWCAFVSLPFHTRSVSAVNCQFLNLLCVCVCGYLCVMAHVWRSEEKELVFSFHHMGTGEQLRSLGVVASTFT